MRSGTYWLEFSLHRSQQCNRVEQGSNQVLLFFSVVARMFAPSVGTMMDGEHAFATRVAPHGDDDRDAFVHFADMFSGIPR